MISLCWFLCFLFFIFKERICNTPLSTILTKLLYNAMRMMPWGGAKWECKLGQKYSLSRWEI